MALLWFDGFNGGTASEIALNYDAGLTSNASTTNSRTGSGHITPNGSSQGLRKNLSFSGSVIVGFGFRHGIDTTSNREIFRFYEGATTHLSLWLLGSASNYVLEVRRGDGQVLGTGTTTIPLDASAAGFRYIEMKAFIHDTLGSFEVRLEGQTEISATGIDTRNGGTTGVPTAVQIMCSISNTAVSMDDYYVADTSGTGVTDFLGPGVRIDYLPAATAGDLAQWTPLSNTNVSNVDETGSNDGDTTYVSAASAGLKDAHNCTDLSFTPSQVIAVQPRIWAKKDEVGDVQVQVRVRSGGVASADTSKSTTTAYACYWGGIIEADPATGAAWTASGANAAQIEYERTV